MHTTPSTPPRHSSFSLQSSAPPRDLHSFPTRRSSDLAQEPQGIGLTALLLLGPGRLERPLAEPQGLLQARSEEHTSELQSRENLVCRLLLEKKNKGGGTSLEAGRPVVACLSQEKRENH